MGNAMDFLNDQDNRDKYRKGNHYTKCKVKIDKYLEDHDTTICPDHELVYKGDAKSTRVNDHVNWESNLPGIHSRMHHKKKEIPCECCKEPFKPCKRKRQLTIAEKKRGLNDQTQWCFRCQQKDTAWRAAMRLVGTKRHAELMLIPMDQQACSEAEDNMYELDLIKRTRLELGRGSKTVDKYIQMWIDRIWDQKHILEVRANQPEFDF